MSENFIVGQSPCGVGCRIFFNVFSIVFTDVIRFNEYRPDNFQIYAFATYLSFKSKSKLA